MRVWAVLSVLLLAAALADAAKAKAKVVCARESYQ